MPNEWRTPGLAHWWVGHEKEIEQAQAQRTGAAISTLTPITPNQFFLNRGVAPFAAFAFGC